MYVCILCMYYALDIRSGDCHNIQVKTVIKDDILLGRKKFSPPLVQSESIYIFRHYYLLFTLYSEAVQRYFESQKRKWREFLDTTQQARTAVQAKKRKIRARKVRVNSYMPYLF